VRRGGRNFVKGSREMRIRPVARRLENGGWRRREGIARD
jgi:hypothetical protein